MARVRRAAPYLDLLLPLARPYGLTLDELVEGDPQAAEFDTRVPHWFGAADDRGVEFLSLFGRQGERAHLRARPRRS